jgi:hypothetical protein
MKKNLWIGADINNKALQPEGFVIAETAIIFFVSWFSRSYQFFFYFLQGYPYGP